MTDSAVGGPTLHTVVMDERTTDLFLLIEREVERSLSEFRMRFVAAQEEAIRQAYMRGVRDGFQQGVLAADSKPIPQGADHPSDGGGEGSHED